MSGEGKVKCELGIIGGGVMGRNLAFNFLSKGKSVFVYDISGDQIDSMLFEAGEEGFKEIYGTDDLGVFLGGLKEPHLILILIKEGEEIDEMIERISELLDSAIIVDCGNSNWLDTGRRYDELEGSNIKYLGCGVSGGHYGARHGPSMMVGGSEEGWKEIQSLLETIAAKDLKGRPCIGWLDHGGAGHFVKMAHNGIEYSIMECIAEIYQGCGFKKEVMNKLDSVLGNGYLTDITRDIVNKTLFNRAEILDVAGQKGTGKWTVEEMASRGVAGQSVSMAVFARIDSGNKPLRDERESNWKKQLVDISGSIQCADEDFLNTYTLVSLITYIQGLELIKVASKEEGWDINLAEVLRIWEGGCIIRSSLVRWLSDLIKSDPDIRICKKYFVDNIEVRKIVERCEVSARKVTLSAISQGHMVPVISGVVSHLDTIRTRNLPTSLTQAQRDYFGKHGIRYVKTPGDVENLPWIQDGDDWANKRIDYMDTQGG